MAGTTKKMYRQKGTGNARAGSRRSGIRRGGGHIHARQPRDWSYRLPKKALRIATRMAVASRIADNEMTLIDKLSFAQPKTREMAAILKALKLDGHSLLVAVPGYDVNVYKSIRNLADVSVLPVAELNALNVLHPKRLADDHVRVGRLPRAKRRKSSEKSSAEAAAKSRSANCKLDR